MAKNASASNGVGHKLVIVESPAKAKTIGKYLGRAYRVKATVGHIMDLPEKKLGIDVDHGFEPELVPIPGKEKTIADLKATGAKVRYFSGAAYMDYLTQSGQLDKNQVDGSYDGTPANWAEHGGHPEARDLLS